MLLISSLKPQFRVLGIGLSIDPEHQFSSSAIDILLDLAYCLTDLDLLSFLDRNRRKVTIDTHVVTMLDDDCIVVGRTATAQNYALEHRTGISSYWC